MKKMNLSKKILLQMAVAFFVIVLIFAWKAKLLADFYGHGEITQLSIFLNGGILIIFIAGIVKLSLALQHYSFEEEELKKFFLEVERNNNNAILAVATKSLLFVRYSRMKKLYDSGAPINHGALASIMIARESLYLSFPKFVHNILILTGVFGTIVSLILALVGAGTILKTSVAGEGMWMIISGMNTALTTTATAIISYFFFTYFYHKLTDLQTFIFSQIEDAVVTNLNQKFPYEQQDVNYKQLHMIEQVTGAVEKMSAQYGDMVSALTAMQEHQKEFSQKLDGISELKSISEQNLQHLNSMNILNEKLEKIAELLTQGFRLKD
ncbi:MAG: hypothetical protein HQK84_08650 [Nitrospinae bacterium]|nr:hypothetical protein [Nitrospinota bacterium]